MEESGLRNDPNHAKDSLLQNLRILWAEKDIEKLQKEIQFVFGALEDPLEWLLDVLEIQGGWKGKGCLAYFLIHGLQLWTREHPTDCQSALKLKKLQARLFLVLAQCHGNLLDPLISIYRLHEADSHFLLGHITHFYYMNQYKEAAILSIKLKLQPYLEVEKVASCIEHVTWEKFRKLCIPLLLQDKMSLVVAYVDGHPDLQEQLLRVLDSWCSPGFQLKDIALQYSDLSNIRPDKLNQRVLNKMIFRFLDKYGLDPAICPNATNQRHMGTLRYLFRQRFVKKVMSEENWADHIQSIVQDNQWLQEHLVKLLVHYCSLDAAATWALQYNLPDDRLPCRVVDAMKVLRLQERETVPEQRADGWEDRKKDAFYQLPIPREKIFFLTTEEEVLKCQEELVQPGQVVGIDMEWRPSFSTVAGKPRISVVQLAIQGQVFLLDIMHLLKQRGLEEEKAEAVLVGFFCSLFANRAVVKLGYGMSGDLHSLMATSAAFRDVGKRLCGFVDLLTIHQQLSTCPGEGKKGCQADALQPKDGRQRSRLQERGLSLLVRHILGKPLDKTEQMSNWEKRPLREEQILYAASDAYCLLEVYAKLQEDLASLEWNPSSTGIPPGKASTSTKAKRSPSQQAALSTPTEDPSPGMEEIPDSSVAIAVQDFHVVCDNMLKGLGRYLRCIGVDVQILENDDEHRKAAEIARQEKRVILTSGLPYQMLQSQVGEGRCFQVKCSEKAKEQALQVLKHFNVHVTLADIFSRCQVCNSDRYLKISKETMVQLMKQKGCLTEEDGAGGFSEDPAEETESKPLGSTQPVYSPNCQWLEESDLDIESVTLPGGTPVRVEAVPLGVLSKEGLTCFYCCGQCGKIYWEGSHFQRVASQLKEVLDLSENSQSFYKRA